MASTESASTNIGVINPRALTEAVLGRKIDWEDTNSKQLIENTLQTRYEDLFDIKNGSPLYAGLKLSAENKIAPVELGEIEVVRAEAITDKPKGFKDLGINSLDDLKFVDSWTSGNLLHLLLDTPTKPHTLTNLKLTQQIIDLATPNKRSTTDLSTSASPPWNGPTTGTWVWRDIGDWVRSGLEYRDPCQGSIANCYYIAAQAAVIWSTPAVIQGRPSNGQVTIKLYTKGGAKDGGANQDITVSEKILVDSATNRPFGCRSTDAGELWPCLYEKAFAKWILHDTHDQPDITQTAYGDCVKACAQITGKNPVYWSNNSQTATQLYQLVRQHSAGGKTIYPMVAWTYATAPAGLNYSTSNIVGNHCYTVLGWYYSVGKQYIVLRNPWGFTEPAGPDTLQGVVTFLQSGVWVPISMIANDGVFAITDMSFKAYFQGIGVAK